MSGWSTGGDALVGPNFLGSGGADIFGKDSALGSFWQDMTGQTNPRNTYSREQDKAALQQQQALDVVGNWGLNGTGPSAAQRLVEMNREQNAANMIGSAKSMPGGNPALANQLASEGIGRGNAAATLQGAQLRSQEQQAAMQNYLTGLGQMRQQDIDMYGRLLGAEQQNTAGRQAAIGGMMNPIGGMLGGILG